MNFGIEHQPQIGDPAGVDVVAGPPRLAGVIANFCAILMAKEQFDCNVAVQYPVFSSQRT